VFYANREVALHTQITAYQKNNENVQDAVWKKIEQSAQVATKNKDALREIFEGYADARSQNNDGKAIMNWLQESVPNADLSTYKNLQNIITSSRDEFAMNQRMLIDVKREHDRLLQSFPSSIILGALGRKPVDIIVVTSAKTKDIFRKGEDNDVVVFK